MISKTSIFFFFTIFEILKNKNKIIFVTILQGEGKYPKNHRNKFLENGRWKNELEANIFPIISLDHGGDEFSHERNSSG